MSIVQPSVTIGVSPGAGALEIDAGALVAGAVHRLRFVNREGDWDKDATFSFLVKLTLSGAAAAYASGFVIDATDKTLMTALLDLYTEPIMTALNGVNLNVYIQLKDTDERYSYRPPVRVTLYNTAFRESDAPPVVPPWGQLEIADGKKLVVLASGQIQVEDI